MVNQLYGIWIEPPKIIRDELEIMIHSIEKEFSSLPGIIPHITLLPAVRGSNPRLMIKEMKEAVKNFQDIPIKFDGLKTGDSVWKSIYINIEKNAQLQLLFDSFLKYFSDRLEITPKAFLPHLSLLYGTFSKEKQLEISSRFQNYTFGAHQFDFNRLFIVGELSLFYLQDLNDPASWSLVKRIRL